MINWTKVEERLPVNIPLGRMQSFSFLTDRFPFMPLMFIGLVQDANCFDKYRSYHGRYNHELKIWQNMAGEQVLGVSHWTEYNEPEDL